MSYLYLFLNIFEDRFYLDNWLTFSLKLGSRFIFFNIVIIPPINALRGNSLFSKYWYGASEASSYHWLPSWNHQLWSHSTHQVFVESLWLTVITSILSQVQNGSVGLFFVDPFSCMISLKETPVSASFLPLRFHFRSCHTSRNAFLCLSQSHPLFRE